MRLKRLTGVGIMIVTMVSSPADAGVSTTSGNISRMTADPSIVMVTTPAISNNDGCNGSGQYVLQKTHANFDASMAMLMTAFSTGKSVSFWIDGCVDVGGGYTYPRIHQVYIYS